MDFQEEAASLESFDEARFGIARLDQSGGLCKESASPEKDEQKNERKKSVHAQNYVQLLFDHSDLLDRRLQCE